MNRYELYRDQIRAPGINVRPEMINPGDGDHTYLFHLGAYGWTALLVWADNLEDAFDTMGNYVAHYHPVLLCDDAVKADYESAIKEGKSEEEAWQIAETDTVTAGSCGHHLLVWEVQVWENPTRAQKLGLL